MNKRIYRSRTDRVIAGVCGGLGAYINVDATIVRIIAVLLGLWSLGTVLLVYLLLALLIPLEPGQ